MDYAGGVPQVALTGSQRGFSTPDRKTLDETTGAMTERPDIAETLIRSRNLAKQAILQALMEDRRAEASKMAQHSHAPQLLVPGTVVDIYRKPDRKDQYGWHGPAELVSVKRQAGSAIVDHQGQPLLVPLRHVRNCLLYTSDAADES